MRKTGSCAGDILPMVISHTQSSRANPSNPVRGETTVIAFVQDSSGCKIELIESQAA